MAISLQTILQKCWKSLSEKFPAYVHRAAYMLAHCRTAVLGGHVLRCEEGHVEAVFYNSCRHRCCPQCSSTPRDQWLELWHEKMLSTPAYHIVFTVPQDLVPLWRMNKQPFANLLMHASKDSLLTLLADPQYLGAKPGLLGALHTWSQTLAAHPHCHFLVTAGGLSPDGQWLKPKRDCLLPRAVIMHMFRGKLVALLKEAITTGELTLPEGKTLANMLALLQRLRRATWNVKLLERYDHAQGVTKYLAKYLRGGPISNQRLIWLRDGQVKFSYLDRREGKPPRRTTMTLPVETFLQRWAQHVPPKGMHTVRAFGLYASGNGDQLAIARRLISPPAPPTPAQPAAVLAQPAAEPKVCSRCGAPLQAFPLVRDPSVKPWKAPNGNPQCPPIEASTRAPPCGSG